MGGLLQENVAAVANVGAVAVGDGGASMEQDSSTCAIARWCEVLKSGHQGLDMQRLLHLAAKGAADEVSPALYALAYLASSLLEAQKRLYATALNYKFQDTTPELLDAYHHFVLNVVSVDVTIVKFALGTMAQKLFLHENAEVRNLAARLFLDILDMYNAADEVVAQTLRQRFPIHSCDIDAHVRYANVTLDIALKCRSARLRGAILGILVEKILGLQSSIPEKYMSPKAVVSMDVTDPQSSDDEADDPKPEKEELELCANAVKLDKMLITVFEFMDKMHKSDPDAFPELVVEPLLDSFARQVIPVRCGRFAPVLLLQALGLAGREVAEATCNRLLERFFDSHVHNEARLSCLALSAMVVGRVRDVRAIFALGWIQRVARWLNHYVDVSCIPNELFFGAVRVLLTLIVVRSDAFDPGHARGPDALARLRMVGVLESHFRPACEIPLDVRRRFSVMAGIDGDWILAKHGRRKKMEFVDLLIHPILPEAQQKLAKYCRQVTTIKYEEEL